MKTLSTDLPLLPRVPCDASIRAGRTVEGVPPVNIVVPDYRAAAPDVPALGRGGAELLVFEESGHMASFEVPEQVGDALRRWLNKYPQDRKH